MAVDAQIVALLHTHLNNTLHAEREVRKNAENELSKLSENTCEFLLNFIRFEFYAPFLYSVCHCTAAISGKLVGGCCGAGRCRLFQELCQSTLEGAMPIPFIFF